RARRPDGPLARRWARRCAHPRSRRSRRTRRLSRRRDRRRARRGATAGRRPAGVLAGGRFEREAQAGRAWSAWARGVVRWRWPAALVSGGLLLALALTGLGVNLGLPESGNLRTSGQGHAGLTALTGAGIPAGVITPIDVLVTGDPDAAAERIRDVEGVAAVLAPDSPSWRREGTAVVSVLPVAENGTAAGEATVTRIREAAPGDPDTASARPVSTCSPATHSGSPCRGIGVRVGGNAAPSMDFRAHAYGAFPWMLALIALVTFVMLARAF